MDPAQALELKLSLEYFSLALLAVLGTLQASAGRSGRQHLFFFPHVSHGYTFAALTVIPAMTGFFTWNLRNPTGIVEGSQQFLLFVLAMATSFCLSYLGSLFVRSGSIICQKFSPGDINHEAG